jgi:hypothetical protein
MRLLRRRAGSDSQEWSRVQLTVAYISLFSAAFIASYVFGDHAVRRLERSRSAVRLVAMARALTRRSR